jgi:hypothetical protein
MYRRFTAALRRRLQLISAVIFGIVFILWTLSLWLPFVSDWLVRNNIFGLILIGLIVQVLALLDELIRGRNIDSGIGRDQSQDLDKLRDYVREHRPETADLIEYSSFMVTSLLEDLMRKQVEIRLLICDPDHAVNEWQSRRIRGCISTLCDFTFAGYSKATVRCYQIPASVRGRHIDDLLNIGWYFYGHEVYGVQGTATMITVNTESSEGILLQTLFTEAFDVLWNHPRTRQLDLATGSMYGAASEV